MLKSKKIYRNAGAVLRAAQRKIGGYLVTYDGSPTLALDSINPVHGAHQTNYLGAEEAADKAGLIYAPRVDDCGFSY